MGRMAGTWRSWMKDDKVGGVLVHLMTEGLVDEVDGVAMVRRWSMVPASMRALDLWVRSWKGVLDESNESVLGWSIVLLLLSGQLHET